MKKHPKRIENMFIVDKEAKQAMANTLKGILADTYTLSLTTQAAHWNVTGANFYSLHALFEEQYKNMAEATDEIAERIRALGVYAPGSYPEFTHLTQVNQEIISTDTEAMLNRLIEDNQVLVKRLSQAIEEGEKFNDEATVDMLIERVQIHDKNIWMLNSSL